MKRRFDALFSPTLTLPLVTFSLVTLSLVTASRGQNEAKQEDRGTPSPDAAAVERVGQDIRYLASDELEGRGPQTKGLELAAQHLESRFKSLGLSGGGKDGSYRDEFEIPVNTEVVEGKTEFLIIPDGGEAVELQRGKDYQPLAAGGNGDVEAEMVFVGYGISAKKQKYDDYAGVDVEGKVVVLIRREPQQGDEKSVFDGKRTSTHALIRTKLDAAKKAKVAAIVMVNDPFTVREKSDELTNPNGFGSRGGGIPFLHMTQAQLNEMLATSPVNVGDKKLKTVDAISDQIDADLKPLSTKLTWKARIQTQFKSVKARVANVIGVLEGEGPLADETIVIGAHYDHLGYGPFGSRKPQQRAVHNGADDNATGTAAVLELAHRFAKADTKPARRMVFVGFTAEERGILGSNRYLANPSFPIEKTVSMINFDMIGMYGKQGVTLGGVNTAKEFADAASRVTEKLNLNVKRSATVGGSDHAGFYRKSVPVLFFHTGLTDLYHTPEDDYETIDVGGAVLTIDLAEAMLKEVLAMELAPTYVKAAPRPRRAVVYLGIVPQFRQGVEGIIVQSVAGNSPASKAGMKAQDIIIKLGDQEIKNFRQLPQLLSRRKVGDEVVVVVKRNDETKSLKVKLAGPPK